MPLLDRSGDVEPAPGTRPEYTPVAEHYRIDIDLRPMKIEEDTCLVESTMFRAASRNGSTLRRQDSNAIKNRWTWIGDFGGPDEQL